MGCSNSAQSTPKIHFAKGGTIKATTLHSKKEISHMEFSDCCQKTNIENSSSKIFHQHYIFEQSRFEFFWEEVGTFLFDFWLPPFQCRQFCSLYPSANFYGILTLSPSNFLDGPNKKSLYVLQTIIELGDDLIEWVQYLALLPSNEILISSCEVQRLVSFSLLQEQKSFDKRCTLKMEKK